MGLEKIAAAGFLSSKSTRIIGLPPCAIARRTGNGGGGGAAAPPISTRHREKARRPKTKRANLGAHFPGFRLPGVGAVCGRHPGTGLTKPIFKTR